MTFTFPTELVVAKAKLESEGIECKVLDEHTIQVHNFLSNALGGVRLQVEASNLERARQILEESGLVDIEHQPEQSNIERKFNDPKFLKRLKIAIVGLIVVTIVLASIVIFYRYLNRPTDLELLTNRYWCIDHIVYQDQEYLPRTLTDKIQIRFMGECHEKLDFRENGYVEFPGFNTYRIHGNWKLEDKMIRVFKVDTLGFLLQQDYRYNIDHRELVLTSNSVQIYCYNPKYYSY